MTYYDSDEDRFVTTPLIIQDEATYEPMPKGEFVLDFQNNKAYYDDEEITILNSNYEIIQVNSIIGLFW